MIKKILLISLSIMLQSCSTDKNNPDQNNNRFFKVGISHHSDSDDFIIWTADAEIIALSREQLNLSKDAVKKHIHGIIKAGDGEYNQPWSWHIDPDNWELADASIELCDGSPTYIEDNLEDWIKTVGYYCPWGSYIKAEI